MNEPKDSSVPVERQTTLNGDSNSDVPVVELTLEQVTENPKKTIGELVSNAIDQRYVNYDSFNEVIAHMLRGVDYITKLHYQLELMRQSGEVKILEVPPGSNVVSLTDTYIKDPERRLDLNQLITLLVVRPGVTSLDRSSFFKYLMKHLKPDYDSGSYTEKGKREDFTDDRHPSIKAV